MSGSDRVPRVEEHLRARRRRTECLQETLSRSSPSPIRRHVTHSQRLDVTVTSLSVMIHHACGDSVMANRGAVGCFDIAGHTFAGYGLSRSIHPSPKSTCEVEFPFFEW